MKIFKNIGVNVIVVLVSMFVLVGNFQAIDKKPIGYLENTNVSKSSPTDEEYQTYVKITTTGSTFSPIVQLAKGSTATVFWEVEGGPTYSGLTPNINFGHIGTRYIHMKAIKDNKNALEDIVTFNIGFNSSQDSGKYNIGPSYNHTEQKVSTLEYINKMTNLKRFLAATSSLTGQLNFTDMSELQYIECFNANVSSIKLTGCKSLVRLCMEGNDLAVLDLNPVAANLYDLRMSGNRSPIKLVPLTSPLSHLYHFCAQGEIVINQPTAEQLPVVEERWDYYSGQSGKLIVRSSAIYSLETMGNAWTSADLTNQFPAGRNGSFYGYDNKFNSVKLTGCAGLVNIDLHNNQLDRHEVDAILTEVESWHSSSTNAKLNLLGNAAPSPTGIIKTNALKGRGWTVSVED